MKQKSIYILLTIAILFGPNANAQEATLTIGDTSNKVISRYIYSQFAEHLGRCIYDGFYRNGKIRMDIVDALKEIQVPSLRWPGGCFADNYHWQDGIGKKSKRPAIVNTQWGMVTDDNSFGTDEFMKLCNLIGCQPYIAGNVGSGTPQEMENWVEYLNYDGPSAMAKLRAKNGHPTPYNVPFWGVGNESWGCGGRMTPEDYASKYKLFANFIKNYDMVKIASGARDDDYHWTEVMMSHIPLWMMQGVGVHYYTLVDGEDGKGPATGFSEEQYFKGLKNALRMDEIIRRHSAIMDKYDPQKQVWLIVDEWGISLNEEPGTNPNFHYQQNSLRDALIAASTLNIFNNHCDRVKMANLAQAVNVLQSLILTQGDKMLLTPTYYVFDLFKGHMDARLLPIKIKTPYYHFGIDSIPAINVSASIDSNKLVHITLVNLDPKQNIEISTTAPFGKSHFSGQVLTSNKFDDINTFDHTKKVKISTFNGANITNGQLNITLPPKSVVSLILQ